MLAVLSLNTAIDRIVVVPGFTPGGVFRARSSSSHAGGKGLNVARALRALGQEVLVLGFLAGTPAPFIEGYCRERGIETRWTATVGESRTCTIVVDPTTGEQTVINEAGPTVSEQEVARLRASVLSSLEPGDTLAFSGSAPPGVPRTFYRNLAADLREAGVQVLADLTGEALRLTLEAHPWGVAPNLEEANAALGEDLPPGEATKRLAACTEQVLLTLGTDGVLYRRGESAWMVRPPGVETVNAVGSGDAFVAGFLAGTVRGQDPVDAVRLGVACGASNASRLEPSIGPEDEIERLLAETVAEPLTGGTAG